MHIYAHTYEHNLCTLAPKLVIPKNRFNKICAIFVHCKLRNTAKKNQRLNSSSLLNIFKMPIFPRLIE